MVERAAECPVCCALMSEPKLLGCAHTYASDFTFLRLLTEVWLSHPFSELDSAKHALPPYPMARHLLNAPNAEWSRLFTNVSTVWRRTSPSLPSSRHSGKYMVIRSCAAAVRKGPWRGRAQSVTFSSAPSAGPPTGRFEYFR